MTLLADSARLRPQAHLSWKRWLRLLWSRLACVPRLVFLSRAVVHSCAGQVGCGMCALLQVWSAVRDRCEFYGRGLLAGVFICSLGITLARAWPRASRIGWPPILSLAGWAVEGGESEVRGQNLGWGWGSVGLCSLGRSQRVTGCLVKPLPTLQLLRCWSSHSRNRPTCSLALFKVGAPELLGWAPRGSLQGGPPLSQFTDTLPQQPLFLPLPANTHLIHVAATQKHSGPQMGFCCAHPFPPAAFGGWEKTPCSGSGEWGERSGWECPQGE